MDELYVVKSEFTCFGCFFAFYCVVPFSPKNLLDTSKIKLRKENSSPNSRLTSACGFRQEPESTDNQKQPHSLFLSMCSKIWQGEFLRWMLVFNSKQHTIPSALCAANFIRFQISSSCSNMIADSTESAFGCFWSFKDLLFVLVLR